MTRIDYIPEGDPLRLGSFFSIDRSYKNIEDAIREARAYSTLRKDCPVRVVCQETTVVWEPEND